MAATQAELAKVFGKSQPWVSKMQRRSVDPMPAELEAAVEWGRRNRLLAGEPEPIVPGGLPVQTSVTPAQPSAFEAADLKLKDARRKKLELELGLKAGELISREDAEAQQVTIAVEFRKTASEFPLRLRPLLERHVADAGIVAAILKDAEAMVADLLNRADPHQVLKDKTKDELRQILLARVEACLE